MTKEFEEAIANFNTWKIVEILEGKNIDIPENETVLFGGIHMARIYLATATDKQKEESKQWLIDHGCVPWISMEQ